LGDALIGTETRIKLAVSKVKANNPELNSIQMKWLERIQKQLLSELILSRETFELEAFKNMGGYKKINAAFGNKLDSYIDEINDTLYENTSA